MLPTSEYSLLGNHDFMNRSDIARMCRCVSHSLRKLEPQVGESVSLEGFKEVKRKCELPFPRETCPIIFAVRGKQLGADSPAEPSRPFLFSRPQMFDCLH